VKRKRQSEAKVGIFLVAIKRRKSIDWAFRMSRDDQIAKLEVYLGRKLLELSQLSLEIPPKFSLFTFVSTLLADQAINNSTSDDELDISALDAFCHVIKSDQDLSAAATRLLAAKIQSQNVKESLFALEALEGNRRFSWFYRAAVQ
jgi:hypothetical protein